jgi:hypothetical protein
MCQFLFLADLAGGRPDVAIWSVYCMVSLVCSALRALHTTNGSLLFSLRLFYCAKRCSLRGSNHVEQSGLLFA